MDYLLNPDNGIVFPWSVSREAEHSDYVKILECEIDMLRRGASVHEILASRKTAEKRHSGASAKKADNVPNKSRGTQEKAILPPEKDVSVFDGGKPEKEKCPDGVNRVSFGKGADTSVIFEYKETVSNKIRQENAEAGEPDLFGNTKRTFMDMDPRLVTTKDLEGVKDEELIQFAKHALAKDFDPCPDGATDDERAEYMLWLRKQITQGVAKLERKRNKFR